MSDNPVISRTALVGNSRLKEEEKGITAIVLGAALNAPLPVADSLMWE